ncbi:aromatic ring-hydroxylating dioxygenase subunit alpha [Asanoa sp. NPDC049518]|uniref:aromatic ring-hydroxylating oxygenase subunit alpha n=1 Tax=unclassified Asanoa TaxID=2685164 RepID=UPI003445609B
MMGAPIEASALEQALRPFGRSTMLPAAAYVGEHVFAWEQRHLFAGSWVSLGRTAALAEGGNQRATTVGDVGVLLIFEAGTPRAFANVCRHRGHELLAEGEAADRPTVLCPYHGWSYSLDGHLRTAPRMGPDFTGTAYGLVELPTVDWHGWLFVNATGTARPFSAHIGTLAAHVEPYRPESLVPKARHDYEVAANWKVIAENYHECYHCPLIHPELCAVSPPNSGNNWRDPGAAWVGGSMDLRDHAETMSLDGRSHGVRLPDVDQRLVRYLGLFPNMLISLHPDYVMTHLLQPLSPSRTRVTCEWLFLDEVTDPSYAVDFWDLTNRQDWAACESVQRGVSSPHFVPGPLAPNENAVYDWVTLIARAYRDPATTL